MKELLVYRADLNARDLLSRRILLQICFSWDPDRHHCWIDIPGMMLGWKP